jgi:alanine dehydrogenase
MIIGVPRERKTLEQRVALTPDGAHHLIDAGHTVLIEKNAGAGSHFPDEAYSFVGCRIVDSLAEVWNEADLVVKVKEPHESEYEYFRPGLALFDYLHLASMPEVTNKLLEGGVTGIAYELVQLADKRLPLLEPMSEIAGKLSVLNGSYFLLSQNGGRGMLPGGAVGVPAAEVVVIGAGIAGISACEYALGLGASVTVLDISRKVLEHAKERFGNQITTEYSTPRSITRNCEKADLLVGAVLVPGAAAPKIITRDAIKAMKPGSVFVDISIDQGGCAETIKATSLDNPVYVEEEVIHYGVCNMPAQTARTSTMALTSVTLPYIMQLANSGVEQTLKSDATVRNALNTHKGKLTNRAVSEAVGIDAISPEEAIG